MADLALLTREELENNPEIIAENIKLLAIALKETKGNLEEIKGRGFWKKITCNNTKDLAEALLKQNDSISAFLTIIQGILFLSMNNVAVLGAIMDSLTKAETANELRDNEYATMAREYLGEALKTAKRAANNEDEIQKVKDGLIERYKAQAERDAEQDKRIREGVSKDTEQDKDMAELKSRLAKQEKELRVWKWGIGLVAIAALIISIISLVI